MPHCRCEDAGVEWNRFPGSTDRTGSRGTAYIHNSARRYSNVRPGNEGRRRRLSPKALQTSQLLESVERALTRSSEQLLSASERDNARALLERLTPREYEVMQLVATGLLNKQVGGELGMAEKTVKTHRAHMMQKLKITSVAELMVILHKAEVSPPVKTGTKV